MRFSPELPQLEVGQAFQPDMSANLASNTSTESFGAGKIQT